MAVSKVGWRKFLIIIQVISIFAMIYVIIINNWFTQKWSQNPENNYLYGTFGGGMIGPNSDLHFCDGGDSYSYCHKKCDEFCDRYQTWSNASIGYLTVEGFAILLAIIIIGVLIFDIAKSRNPVFFIASLLMLMIFVLHLLALIIWSVVAKLSFSDCKHVSTYSGSQTICPDTGFVYCILSLIYLAIANIVNCCVVRKLNSRDQDQNNIRLV